MQRNINGLKGHSLTSSKGEIGDGRVFYFDNKTWRIRCLLIKTERWLSYHEVLITPFKPIQSRAGHVFCKSNYDPKSVNWFLLCKGGMLLSTILFVTGVFYPSHDAAI